MPWSWKTTIWKDLATKLWMNFLDFDDDVIEKVMNKTVWEKLIELWEEKFIQMEENLALDLDIQNTVLCTSGSLPLSDKAMIKLKKLWKVIYLNINIEVVKQRLSIMKVDRIIWMDNMTLEEILIYRKSFYEKSFNYEFKLDTKWTKEEIFKVFFDWFIKI